MDCTAYEKRLSEYLEGELSGALRLDVAQHLKECERCTTELRELHQVVSAVRRIPAVEPPEQLTPQILNALRQPAPQREAWTTRLRGWLTPAPAPAAWAAGAAAIAVIALVGGSFLRPAPEPQQVRTSPAPSQVATAPEPLERSAPVVEAPAPEPAPVQLAEAPPVPEPQRESSPPREPRSLPMPSAEAERLAGSPQLARLSEAWRPDATLEPKLGEPRSRVEPGGISPVVPPPTLPPAEPPAEPPVASSDSDRVATSRGVDVEIDTGTVEDVVLTVRQQLQEQNRVIPQPPPLEPGQGEQRSNPAG